MELDVRQLGYGKWGNLLLFLKKVVNGNDALYAAHEELFKVFHRGIGYGHSAFSKVGKQGFVAVGTGVELHRYLVNNGIASPCTTGRAYFPLRQGAHSSAQEYSLPWQCRLEYDSRLRGLMHGRHEGPHEAGSSRRRAVVSPQSGRHGRCWT